MKRVLTFSSEFCTQIVYDNDLRQLIGQGDFESTAPQSCEGITKLTIKDCPLLTAIPVLFDNLQELDIINCNKITDELPGHLFQLSSLTKLTISKTGIQSIPQEFTRLQQLEYCQLTHNKIAHIPCELKNMTNLKTLVLTGNALTGDYTQQQLMQVDILRTSLRKNSENPMILSVGVFVICYHAERQIIGSLHDEKKFARINCTNHHNSLHTTDGRPLELRLNIHYLSDIDSGNNLEKMNVMYSSQSLFIINVDRTGRRDVYIFRQIELIQRMAPGSIILVYHKDAFGDVQALNNIKNRINERYHFISSGIPCVDSFLERNDCAPRVFFKNVVVESDQQLIQVLHSQIIDGDITPNDRQSISSDIPVSNNNRLIELPSTPSTLSSTPKMSPNETIRRHRSFEALSPLNRSGCESLSPTISETSRRHTSFDTYTENDSCELVLRRIKTDIVMFATAKIKQGNAVVGISLNQGKSYDSYCSPGQDRPVYLLELVMFLETIRETVQIVSLSSLRESFRKYALALQLFVDSETDFRNALIHLHMAGEVVYCPQVLSDVVIIDPHMVPQLVHSISCCDAPWKSSHSTCISSSDLWSSIETLPIIANAKVSDVETKSVVIALLKYSSEIISIPTAIETFKVKSQVDNHGKSISHSNTSNNYHEISQISKIIDDEYDIDISDEHFDDAMELQDAQFDEKPDVSVEKNNEEHFIVPLLFSRNHSSSIEEKYRKLRLYGNMCCFFWEYDFSIPSSLAVYYETVALLFRRPEFPPVFDVLNPNFSHVTFSHCSHAEFLITFETFDVIVYSSDDFTRFSTAFVCSIDESDFVHATAIKFDEVIAEFLRNKDAFISSFEYCPCCIQQYFWEQLLKDEFVDNAKHCPCVQASSCCSEISSVGTPRLTHESRNSLTPRAPSASLHRTSSQPTTLSYLHGKTTSLPPLVIPTTPTPPTNPTPSTRSASTSQISESSSIKQNVFLSPEQCRTPSSTSLKSSKSKLHASSSKKLSNLPRAPLFEVRELEKVTSLWKVNDNSLLFRELYNINGEFFDINEKFKAMDLRENYQNSDDCRGKFETDSNKHPCGNDVDKNNCCCGWQQEVRPEKVISDDPNIIKAKTRFICQELCRLSPIRLDVDSEHWGPLADTLTLRSLARDVIRGRHANRHEFGPWSVIDDLIARNKKFQCLQNSENRQACQEYLLSCGILIADTTSRFCLHATPCRWDFLFAEYNLCKDSDILISRRMENFCLNIGAKLWHDDDCSLSDIKQRDISLEFYSNIRYKKVFTVRNGFSISKGRELFERILSKVKCSPLQSMRYFMLNQPLLTLCISIGCIEALGDGITKNHPQFVVVIFCDHLGNSKTSSEMFVEVDAIGFNTKASEMLEIMDIVGGELPRDADATSYCPLCLSRDISCYGTYDSMAAERLRAELKALGDCCKSNDSVPNYEYDVEDFSKSQRIQESNCEKVEGCRNRHECSATGPSNCAIRDLSNLTSLYSWYLQTCYCSNGCRLLPEHLVPLAAARQRIGLEIIQSEDHRLSFLLDSIAASRTNKVPQQALVYLKFVQNPPSWMTKDHMSQFYAPNHHRLSDTKLANNSWKIGQKDSYIIRKDCADFSFVSEVENHVLLNQNSSSCNSDSDLSHLSIRSSPSCTPLGHVQCYAHFGEVANNPLSEYSKKVYGCTICTGTVVKFQERHFILTCAHGFLVSNPDDIEGYIADINKNLQLCFASYKSNFPMMSRIEKLYCDMNNDIMVFEILNSRNRHLASVEFSETPLSIGQLVHHSGFSKFSTHVEVKYGHIVSVKPYEVTVDMFSSHGNSGGPLFDQDGRLIGILLSGLVTNQTSIVRIMDKDKFGNIIHGKQYNQDV